MTSARLVSCVCAALVDGESEVAAIAPPLAIAANAAAIDKAMTVRLFNMGMRVLGN
jgi:hypothetical protein